MSSVKFRELPEQRASVIASTELSSLQIGAKLSVCVHATAIYTSFLERNALQAAMSNVCTLVCVFSLSNLQVKLNLAQNIACGVWFINPLNAELNPICHLLALLGAHHNLHVSRIRVKDIFSEFSTITLL